MEQISIRAPRAGDGDSLARIWLDAAKYYAGLNPELFQVPRADGLDDWCEQWVKSIRENTLFLVAEENQRVVGFISARFVPPMEEAARQFVRDVGYPRLMIDAVVVEQTFWHHGIGTQLMNKAEEWGKSRGAKIVLLDTYISSPVSVRFYESSLGYQRRALLFRKKLV